MADRYAVQSGVWSDPGTWDGGTLPEPGDTVRPSGYTVEIDMDIEVGLLTNDAVGRFTVSTVSGLTIEASIRGGRSNTAPVVVSTTVTVVGDVAGGGGNGHRSVEVAADGVLTLTGDVTGGSSNAAYGVYVTGGSVEVTGDVTGGSSNAAYGVYVTGGSVEVTGDVTGGSGNAYGVYVTGGVADIDGAVEASTIPAVDGGGNALIRFSGPLINSPTGVSAVVAERWMIHQDHNFVWQVTDDQAAPASGDPVFVTVWNDHTPPPGDTRAGHVYGHGGTLTGTLDVPPPESVAAGVPTDDTTGTAALAPSDVWDLQPDRLKNVATVATTGAQLEAALDTGDDS